jgi:hypothetical protein
LKGTATIRAAVYPARQLGLTALLLSFAFSAVASATPQFRDFPAAFESGPSAPLQWTKTTRLFRTRMAAAARKPANFAGHYVLASWGCGATCVAGAVVDKRNGAIFSLPFSICCATPKSASFRPIEFRPTSRLVVFAGLRNEQPPMGAHFYAFDGSGFNFIATTPDDGSFSAAAVRGAAASDSTSAGVRRNDAASSAAPLKKGMPYVEARKRLTEAGWSVPALPAGGYGRNAKKVVEECSGDVAMCDAFPEIRNCSGTGYCLMVLTDRAGDSLEVTTYGDLSGDNRDAVVTAWRRRTAAH